LVVKWYELTEDILRTYVEHVRRTTEVGGLDVATFVPLLHKDVRLVSNALREKLRDRVVTTLRKHHHQNKGDVERAVACVRSLFDATAGELETLTKTLWATYEKNVVLRSTKRIKMEVETIARNFRFHTKTSTTKGKIVPNGYVETMLMPMQCMEEDEVERSVVVNVVDRVSELYQGAVADMLDDARKTEASLQRMKKTAGNIALMAGSSSIGGGSSGLNKIVDQVSCDMRHYADIVKTMLRDGESSNGLEKLHEWLAVKRRSGV
jgi:hypothetical protein